jgi:hypothetical protein
MHTLTEQEAAWAAAFGPASPAPLGAQLAAAINRLDAGAFAALLAEWCTYESQAVREALEGGEKVAAHFAGKFELLRAAGPAALVSAELATDPAGRPCVLLHQRDSAFGRPGLGKLASYLTAAVRSDGKAVALHMGSSVPSPSECRGSGLFPGLDDREVAARRSFEGGRIPLSPEVTLLLFAMPRVSVCDDMVRSFRETLALLQPARGRVVASGAKDACAEHGVSGFPTLLVQWRGETVRTLEGHHSPQQIRAALDDLFS